MLLLLPWSEPTTELPATVACAIPDPEEITTRSLCYSFAAILVGLAAFATPSYAQVAHNMPRPHHGWTQFAIDVLSGRPDSVTGGDALIGVTVRKKVALGDVRILLNGAEVTSSFTADAGAHTLTARLGGIPARAPI